MATPCFDDETLAALVAGTLSDEARAHIDGCASCRQLVARTIGAATTLTADPERARAAAERARDPFVPGKWIGGKYRIEGTLGEGGFGRVLVAHQADLARRVAVKVLHDPSDADRFVREARIIASLKSEHAVKIFDFGRTPDGEPWLVMELLEGEDLASVAKKRRPSPGEAQAWMLDACDALAEAHARGVVHRDLKPSNLFLADSPAGPRLKVLDFGVAKMHDGLRTTGDVPVGTPAFMSPEQILAPSMVDARSDVWSLGVTIYAVLTGRTFGSGDNTGAFEAVLLDTLTPLRQARPDVPERFAAVIARCMREDRAERFQSMNELADALRAREERPRPRRSMAAKPKSAKQSATVFFVGLTASLVVGAIVLGAVLTTRTSPKPALAAPVSPDASDEDDVSPVFPSPPLASGNRDPILPSAVASHPSVRPTGPAVSFNAIHIDAMGPPVATLKVFASKYRANGMSIDLDAVKVKLQGESAKVIKCLNSTGWRRTNVVITVHPRGAAQVTQGRPHETSICIRDALVGLRFEASIQADTTESTYEIDVDFVGE